MSELTVLVSDDHHRVAIGGEIDVANAYQLDAALAGLCGDVDVDCTAVQFIGSGGFSSLDCGYKATVAGGGTFARVRYEHLSAKNRRHPVCAVRPLRMGTSHYLGAMLATAVMVLALATFATVATISVLAV